jgi:hypothetical protein
LLSEPPEAIEVTVKRVDALLLVILWIFQTPSVTMLLPPDPTMQLTLEPP